MKFRYENFVAAIFCLLAVNSAQAAEPTYKSQPLSQWLLVLELERAGHDNEIPAGMEQPEDAIRQIGTKAIPTLLDILGATDRSKWWTLEKLKSSGFRQMYDSSAATCEDLRSVAVDGFGILGTNAEPAIPQLTKLFHKYGETFNQTIRALNAIGPKGFAVLTNAMNDPDYSVRNNLIWVIGEEGGGDPKLVTQLLINALKDPYWSNRGNAADNLRGKEPALVIPALIPLLDDEYYPCVHAADTLGTYGPAAKIAAPKLLSVFTNVVVGTNAFLIKNLTGGLLDALRKIDPETAGKAEAFIINGGPLGVAGYGWTETLLPNGKELIAGGLFQTTIPTRTNHVFSHAELFDPATGKRTETGSMNVAREYSTATLLRNGKVLVTGGDTGSIFNSLTSAELYDPMTGKWTMTGSMNSAHPNEQAVLQPDGKVRVSGWIGDYQKRPDDDLYDPTTGTWTMVTNK